MDNPSSECDHRRGEKSYPFHPDRAMFPTLAPTKAIRPNNNYGGGEHKQNVDRRTVCNGKVQR